MSGGGEAEEFETGAGGGVVDYVEGAAWVVVFDSEGVEVGCCGGEVEEMDLLGKGGGGGVVVDVEVALGLGMVEDALVGCWIGSSSRQNNMLGVWQQNHNSEHWKRRQRTYHDSIPPISPLIAAQECQPVEAFGQNDILAIPQLVCKLDFVRRESTTTVDLAGCVVLEREDESDTLVQKRPEDEREQDCLSGD
jgi:hypothetical protein